MPRKQLYDTIQVIALLLLIFGTWFLLDGRMMDASDIHFVYQDF